MGLWKDKCKARGVEVCAPGIAKPAEHVSTEAPTVQVPPQGFQFSWKRKSSAVFPVQNGSTLPGCVSQGVSLGSCQS